MPRSGSSEPRELARSGASTWPTLRDFFGLDGTRSLVEVVRRLYEQGSVEEETWRRLEVLEYAVGDVAADLPARDAARPPDAPLAQPTGEQAAILARVAELTTTALSRAAKDPRTAAALADAGASLRQRLQAGDERRVAELRKQLQGEIDLDDE